MTYTVCRHRVIQYVAFAAFAFCSLLSTSCAEQSAKGDESRETAKAEIQRPLVVVTVASGDRLLDRFVQVGQLAGMKASRKQVLDAIGHETGELKGFDLTKPFGFMSFYVDGSPWGKEPADPDMANDEAEPKPASDKTEPSEKSEPSDPPAAGDDDAGVDHSADWFLGGLDNLMGVLDSLNNFDNPERSVAFVPISDFELAQRTIVESMGVAPNPDKPGVYTVADTEISIRHIGNYLVVGMNAERVARCPDPVAVIPQLIRGNDLVASFQMSGLPIEMRTAWIKANKRSLATKREQQEGESDAAFALRCALGDLGGELLELAVSHVDAVNVAVNIDPVRNQMTSDVHVVGPENGKLAKFVREWSTNDSLMYDLPQLDGPVSLHIAMEIPDRHCKPIAAALKDYVDHLDGVEEMMIQMFKPLIEGATSLINSGQFEFLCTAGGKEGHWAPILGLRVPGGNERSEDFKKMLSLFQLIGAKIQLEKKSLNEIPVHLLISEDLKEVLDPLFGSIADISSHFWLAATSEAIWLSASDGDAADGPSALLASAVRQTTPRTTKPSKAAASGIPLMRLSLHTKDWKFDEPITDVDPEEADPGEADPDVRKLQRAEAEKAKKQQQAIQTLFDEKGDGVYAELRPVPDGFKLSIRWEEAFLARCGQSIAGDFDDLSRYFKKDELDPTVAPGSENAPQEADKHYRRAALLVEKGDFEKGQQHFKEGLNLDPNNGEILNGLAWLLATCPEDRFRNGKQAVEYATKACELKDWTNCQTLDTLAAAYAESGDFENAVKWEEKAVKLAPRNEKAQMREMLELFRANKPFRQPAKNKKADE